MPIDLLTLTTYDHSRLPDIRHHLLDVYAEVYEHDIATQPFFSMERFEQRLAGHTSAPDWGCVIGDVNGTTVGYSYGFRASSDRIWKGLQVTVDPEVTREDGHRTFVLCELMVRTPWRGKGIARAIHDQLVASRPEQRVNLLVERTHPKVKALYESWGYRHIGGFLPFPDAPMYDTMLLEI